MGYDATGADYDRKRKALETKEAGLRAYDKEHGTNRLAEHSRDEQRKYDEGKRAYNARQNMQPVEQHSPTQIHVPSWKTIVLGGSGGIRVRM